MTCTSTLPNKVDKNIEAFNQMYETCNRQNNEFSTIFIIFFSLSFFDMAQFFCLAKCVTLKVGTGNKEIISPHEH